MLGTESWGINITTHCLSVSGRSSWEEDLGELRTLPEAMMEQFGRWKTFFLNEAMWSAFMIGRRISDAWTDGALLLLLGLLLLGSCRSETTSLPGTKGGGPP